MKKKMLAGQHNLLVGTLLVLLLSLFGCGGGSSGTGGNRFEGSVYSVEKMPLPNVEVTIAETGDSAITDANGFYSFASELPEGSITYVFTKDDSTVSSTLSPVAPAAVISVDFEISLESESAMPIRIEVHGPDPSAADDDGDDDDGDRTDDSEDDAGENEVDGKNEDIGEDEDEENSPGGEQSPGNGTQPANNSDGNPGNGKPEDTPGNKPEDQPGNKPNENPGHLGNKPEENPGNKPEQNPGNKPDQNPGSNL